MHKIISLCICVIVYLCTFTVYALDDNPVENSSADTPAEKEDADSCCENHSVLKDAGTILYKTPENFLNQFIYIDSLVYIFASVGTMITMNKYDAGIQDKIEEKQYLGKRVHKAGDIIGVFTNIPVLQFGSYYYALKVCNEKMLNFSIELLAAHLLVNLEILIISNIPYHERPNEEDDKPSFLERAFRGRSSFPSGHIAGISTLMFKGWEYYGYAMGLPALALMAYVGWARLESGDHYLSDLLGTVALAGVASLATSRTYRSYLCLPENLFMLPYFTSSGAGFSVLYRI